MTDMGTARRLGSEGSQVRVRFIEAAKAILSEEGEHGLSARQVAAKAGLKAQLLYYYFRTMDELVLAVIELVNEHRRAGFEEALASRRPLRALWMQMSDPSTAALGAALTSAAMHRDAVRPEIIAAAREFRRLQTATVARLLPPSALEEMPCSPAGIVMMAASLARMVVNEQGLGLSEGHAEALATVEAFLAKVESE